MDNYEIKSDVPVMHFCEYCWATLNEDGTCPTDGCIHNELMELDNDVKSKQLMNIGILPVIGVERINYKKELI